MCEHVARLPPPALSSDRRSSSVAATIATNLINPAVADAADFAMPMPNFGSSNVVAESEVRQGVYREYEIDVTPQQVDSADSTFKSAKETKSKKGKYI